MEHIRDAVLKEQLKGMKIVFEDNFDTPELDMTKWDFTNYMEGYSDMPALTSSDVQSIERMKTATVFFVLPLKEQEKILLKL